MEPETTSPTSTRSERLKAALKKPAILVLIGILVFTVGLRIYYSSITAEQTLWWDEAEYGAMAKHFAYDIEYPLGTQRPYLFSGIISFLFLAGLSEHVVKLLMVVLPSIVLVFVTYLLGKEMYNERVGLIAGFLTAVSWTYVFWSTRLQPDFLSMVFSVLAFWCMWRYWKHPRRSLAVWAGITAALAFQFKVSGLLVGAALFVFLLIKERMSWIKNKDYWIALGAFLIALLPQFIYSWIVFGNPFSFLTDSGYAGVVTESRAFGWYNFKFYYLLTENILFVLFVIGLIMALRFLLYLDLLAKDKHKCFDANILTIIVFIVVSAFYIFWIKDTDDRWVFLWLPFIFLTIGNALELIYHYLQRFNKNFASIAIIVLLLAGMWMQLGHANGLIELKKSSYEPVKQAGLWLKQNSAAEDLIISNSHTQTSYYAEREVAVWPRDKNETWFNGYVDERRPAYVIISHFEPHVPWVFSWINQNQNRLVPVQAYFADVEKKEPILIIYQVAYNTTQELMP